MALTVRWRGEEFVRHQLPNTIANRMNVLGAKMVAASVRMLSGHSPSAPGQPPGVGKGRLRRSIRFEVKRTAEATVLRVGTNLVYAPVHEFGGRKPYDIVAVRARALRWQTGTKTYAFAKRVHRQPLPPRPFLEPLLRQSRADIESTLREP